MMNSSDFMGISWEDRSKLMGRSQIETDFGVVNLHLPPQKKMTGNPRKPEDRGPKKVGDSNIGSQ